MSLLVLQEAWVSVGLSTTPADGPAPVSAAESERSKFRKHFGRFDILFFLLCTIVGVDTIGIVASSGAEAFTWLIVLAVVFFVPSALLTAELGTAFAEEGGPYIWTSRAFGRLNPLLRHRQVDSHRRGMVPIRAARALHAHRGRLRHQARPARIRLR
jgi:hypothetical protein